MHFQDAHTYKYIDKDSIINTGQKYLNYVAKIGYVSNMEMYAGAQTKSVSQYNTWGTQGRSYTF